MKRHFLTGLKAFAVSALALAAVSCYDDSELWGELEGLEQRVAALEEKLNSEVATLNSKIGAVETAYKAADADLLKKLNDLDAKLVAELAKLAADLDAADGSLDGLVTTDDLAAEIKKLTDAANAKYAELAGVDKEILAALTKVAVTKVEKNAAGNAVLTFLDGTTLEVGAADANANNTGLVTVVDGKWAIVGEDGKTTVLDALVHPDTELKFKVDPKSYEVFVSYDGKEWVATGVIVKDEQTINLVTGFVDAKDHVVITVGGVEYKLPKVSTNSFDIVSGMVFFAEGETKAIPVAMEGVVSSMVAKAPAGWTATLTDLGLNVTAPGTPADSGMDEDWGVLSEMNAEVTEESGSIEMWVVTEDGKTLVGKLYVAVNDSFVTISVDNDNNITFNISEDYYYSLNYDSNLYEVAYGVVSKDKFNEVELSKKLLSISDDLLNLPSGININYDVEDKWLSEITVNLEDLLGYTPSDDETYLIWAYPYKYAQYNIYDSKLCFVTKQVSYSDITVKFDILSTSFKDVEFAVNVDGADRYYLGYSFKSSDDLLQQELAMLDYFKEMGVKSLCDLLVNGISNPYGGANELITYGKIYDGKFNGFVSEIYDGAFNAMPNQSVTLWVLPLIDGKDFDEYTVEDLYFKDTKIADLSWSGTSSISFGEVLEKTYSYFKIPVSTTGERIYYSLMPTDDYNDFVEELSVDGMTLLDYYLEYGQYQYLSVLDDKSAILTFDSYDSGCEQLKPATEYTLFAFGVDADGKCGEIKTASTTTSDLPYSTDNLSITSIEASSVCGDGEIKFAITGAPVKLHYMIKTKTFSYMPFPDEDEYIDMLLDGLSEESSFTVVELSDDEINDGSYTVNVSIRNQYERKVYAFLEDAAGNISTICASNQFTNDAGIQNSEDFAAAVAAGGVVNLGANITLTEKITISADKEVTINLRGKTVTFDNSGTAGYAILNYGKLTVSNGTIIAQGTAFAAGLYNEGEATLNCNITSENSNAIKVDKGGKLTINGGKYEAKNPTGQALRVGNWNPGQASAWELYINGGEFVAPWAALYIVNNYEGLETAGKAVIKNASFEGSMEVVTDGVKGGDIVFDKVKDVTIEDCTLKTQSIHSETTGESVINGKTITTIDNVYSTVFAAE